MNMDKVFFYFLVSIFMLLLFGSMGIVYLGIYLSILFLWDFYKFCKYDKGNKAECCKPKPKKSKLFHLSEQDFK